MIQSVILIVKYSFGGVGEGGGEGEGTRGLWFELSCFYLNLGSVSSSGLTHILNFET
jgi:hypothetical protein